MSSFTASDVPDQSGKTFLVTGANTGIGFEAAMVLAERAPDASLHPERHPARVQGDSAVNFCLGLC